MFVVNYFWHVYWFWCWFLAWCCITVSPVRALFLLLHFTATFIIIEQLRCLCKRWTRKSHNAVQLHETVVMSFCTDSARQVCCVLAWKSKLLKLIYLSRVYRWEAERALWEVGSPSRKGSPVYNSNTECQFFRSSEIFSVDEQYCIYQ